jgi:hypothetical protein
VCVVTVVDEPVELAGVVLELIFEVNVVVLVWVVAVSVLVFVCVELAEVVLELTVEVKLKVDDSVEVVRLLQMSSHFSYAICTPWS